MLLIRMALLDRTVALEDLLKGLAGESVPGAENTESPSGSVRTQPAHASVPRTVQRPSTRPGYPPQLEAPNAPAVAEAPASKPPAPSPNEGQLREMKQAMETTAQDSNRSRMTREALKEERIGMLRQKDPALGAAIDELDLELLD